MLSASPIPDVSTGRHTRHTRRNQSGPESMDSKVDARSRISSHSLSRGSSWAQCRLRQSQTPCSDCGSARYLSARCAAQHDVDFRALTHSDRLLSVAPRDHPAPNQRDLAAPHPLSARAQK
eukprot:962520-Rhodomonas_salina.2